MFKKKRVLLGTDGPEQLLYFFGVKAVFPPEANDFHKKVRYINDESKLILMPIDLSGRWYLDAAGPILARDKDGISHALIPDFRGRYYLFDEGLGKNMRINAKNSTLFIREAYSATRNFSRETVSFRDVVMIAAKELTAYEAMILVLFSLLGGALLSVLAAIHRTVFSTMIIKADSTSFFEASCALAGVMLILLLLLWTGERVLRRVAQKTAASVLPAMVLRLYSSGCRSKPEMGAEMASLSTNLEKTAAWILGCGCGILLIIAMIPELFFSSFKVCIAGVIITLVLFAFAAIQFHIQRSKEEDDGETERRSWLRSRKIDKLLGIDRRSPISDGKSAIGPLPGLIYLLLPLLMLPLYTLSAKNAASASGFASLAVLYVPLVVIPLWLLSEAAPAGHRFAEISLLLPLMEKRQRFSSKLPPEGSELVLKNITFQYPGCSEPLFCGLNLHIKQGECLGIYGPTGSGKTTLAMILCGALSPGSGFVYYGDGELQNYNPESLSRRIASGGDADILLLERVALSEEIKGRTAVVFSARESDLSSCDRILSLVEGRLV